MDRAIKSINWIITNKCNSKCSHCDIWQTDNSDLDIDELKRILDDDCIIKGYEALGSKFDISLGGGEPFLRPDLQEVVDIIENKFPGALKAISTNGLLTKRILGFLRENSGLNIKLNISIDGIGKVHDKVRGIEGGFKKTCNTIYQIKRFFPKQKIEMKLTLLPDNYNQIIDVYNLSVKLGCDFSFKPAENMKNYTNSLREVNLGFTQEQICNIRNQAFELSDIMYEREKYAKARFFQDIPFYLADKKKPVGCSVVNDHITVLSNGDALMCPKADVLGNLKEQSIKDLTILNKDKCESCMLMCGSFKDYSNDFFEKKIANVETTLNCNLDCDMCTQKELRKSKIEDMDIDTFKGIIDNNIITHVSFVGGEPFLNKNFFEMMDYLDSKGITYEITTNGTQIDNLVLDKLKDCIGLKKINFSLDGLKEYHDNERGEGVFDKCVSSLLLLRDTFNVNVCTVVKEDNVDEILKLGKYIFDLGIKNQKLIYGMDFGHELVESRKRYPEIMIHGPKCNSLKNYDKFISLMDQISFLGLNVETEPGIICQNDKDSKNVYCSQLRNLRFDNNGNRIICEFLRSKSSPDLINELSDNLLPICYKCCKLRLVKNEKGSGLDLFEMRKQWLESYKTNNKYSFGNLGPEETLILINKESVKGGLLPVGLNLQFNLDIGCNANCIMCRDRSKQKLSDKSYSRYLQFLDLIDIPIVRLTIMGGEPLLDKWGLLTLVEKCGARGIDVDITTNGSLLTEDYLDKLIESGLQGITVSIDSDKAEDHDMIRHLPGAFDHLMQVLNYAKLKHPSFNLSVNTVLMRQNVNSIKGIVNMANDIGASNLNFIYVDNQNDNYDRIKLSEQDFDYIEKVKNSHEILGSKTRILWDICNLHNMRGNLKSGCKLRYITKMQVWEDSSISVCNKYSINKKVKLDKALSKIIKSDIWYFFGQDKGHCSIK